MVRAQQAGAIIRAAKDNSIRANQTELISTLLSTPYNGGTPLATLLLEVMHYYHGKEINRAEDYVFGLPRTSGYVYNTAPTDPAAHNNGTYVSPINFECQRNYVIQVTDGQPSGDNAAGIDFRASNSEYPN